MRSTCSIYRNSPGCLWTGLQGGFGFGNFLWLVFPSEEDVGPCGQCFWYLLLFCLFVFFVVS